MLRLWVGLALSGMALSTVAVKAENVSQATRIVFGRNGLQSVKAGGQEFLASGELRVRHVLLRDWAGMETEGDSRPLKTQAELKSSTLTRVYRWGRIQCVYAAQGNCVRLRIQVTNTSTAILKGLSFSVGTLRLPASATGLKAPGQMVPSVGAPGIVVHEGDDTLAFCNEEVGRPLYIGMLTAGGDAKTVDLPVATFREEQFPRGWLTTPQIDRPLYPGDSDHFMVSLRFGPSGASETQLAGDVIEKFAQSYPRKTGWKDRRLIGTLHLGAVEYRRPDNPRGWLAGDGSVDTTTESGRAAFRDRLLKYADNSVAILKDMNAQGMIVWDIEGNEYPHATTYLGDPRSLPPEIAPVIDAFFKKFTDAGLRVGICIRPSQPVRRIYSGEAWQIQSDDPAYLLNEKIAYARKRWGCSIFYIDSNVVYDPHFQPSDGAGYELMPATVFQNVAAANPDVLLMPEQKDARYYAYSSPYMEFRQGFTGTPDRVRALYPKAFSMIYVPDGPIDQRREALVAAVKRGDILLFRAWWPDEINAKVKSIYAEAQK